jgi:hypothetical protein
MYYKTSNSLTETSKETAIKADSQRKLEHSGSWNTAEAGTQRKLEQRLKTL